MSVISTWDDSINILITLINYPRKDAAVAGDSRYLKERRSIVLQCILGKFLNESCSQTLKFGPGMKPSAKHFRKHKGI